MRVGSVSNHTEAINSLVVLYFAIKDSPAKRADLTACLLVIESKVFCMLADDVLTKTVDLPERSFAVLETPITIKFLVKIVLAIASCASSEALPRVFANRLLPAPSIALVVCTAELMTFVEP